MHGQEDILRERFSQHLCGSCGATQRQEDVITLAHRASRWLVLVTCWRCQRRGIFIATFPRNEQSLSAQSLSVDAQCPPFTPPVTSGDGPSLTSLSLSTSDNAPVSLGDVDAMRRFLLNFNGDFRALFGGDAG